MRSQRTMRWTFLLGCVLPGFVSVMVGRSNAQNVSAFPEARASGLMANPPAAFTSPTAPSAYSIVATISGGTKTVCASGCNYATLTGAGGVFADINAKVLTGNLEIQIAGDLVAGEDGSNALNAISEEPPGSNFTVKIYPTGVARSITSTTAPAGGFIRLNAADRVTIDGSLGGTGTDRSLTITDTNNGTSSAVIWLQSHGTDGAQNNTVRNLNVVGHSTTSTLFGIGAGGSTVGPSSLGTNNNANTIRNNNITRVQYGIYSQGAGATTKNTGNVISQNVMNAALPDGVWKGGIWLGFEQNVLVSQNRIAVTHTDVSDAFGIALGLTSLSPIEFTGNEVTDATVERNAIGPVKCTQTSLAHSAVGITVASATSGTNLIRNNMIYEVFSHAGHSPSLVAGIFLGGGAGSTTQVYANSVSLTGSTDYPHNIIGLAIGGTYPVVDARDNIFYNTQDPNNASISCAIATNSFSFGNLTSDFNDLFVPPGSGFAIGKTGGLFYPGSPLVSLSDWQNATGEDSNSISADLVFASLTDLHLSSCSGVSPAENAGTHIAAVTHDYDDDSRSAPSPDIGADEKSGDATDDVDLSLTMVDAQDPVGFGGQIIYTLTVTNQEPHFASSLTLTDATPAGTTFLSVTAPGWSCIAPPVGTSGTVTCTRPGLSCRSTSTMTIAVTVNQCAEVGTVVTNTASVTAENADPQPANNTAVTTTGTAGIPGWCDDGNPCTDDSCDPMTDTCLHTSDDTNPCSDGNPCTIDHCTSGMCTGIQTSPAEINDSLRVTKSGAATTILWSDAPGPYNVYRGLKGSVSAWVYNQQCMASRVASSQVMESEMPPIGRTYFYLITRTAPCEESIPGRASNGIPIPNDHPCGAP